MDVMEMLREDDQEVDILNDVITEPEPVKAEPKQTQAKYNPSQDIKEKMALAKEIKEMKAKLGDMEGAFYEISKENEGLKGAVGSVSKMAGESNNERIKGYIERDWNEAGQGIVDDPAFKHLFDIKEARDYSNQIAVKESRYVSPKEATAIKLLEKILPEYKRMFNQERNKRIMFEGIESEYKPSQKQERISPKTREDVKRNAMADWGDGD